jgi:hypothetical protein
MSSCFVLFLFVGETAWGQQQQQHWENVWYTPDKTYCTSSCTPDWIYNNLGNCYGLNIAGVAVDTFYRWRKMSDNYPNLSLCNTNIGETRIGSFEYTINMSTGILTSIKTMQECTSSGWNHETYFFDTISVSSSPPTSTDYPHQHISGSDPHSITVNAKGGVYDHFYWGAPTWSHKFKELPPLIKRLFPDGIWQQLLLKTKSLDFIEDIQYSSKCNFNRG